ncbi:hypothetical protein F1609_17205 [Massilia sp. CCM 8693]|uniref:Uncharacterized protein n=1 Tax=Massilia aquatica TaxID=2609000 RepID=A0ABX0M5M4_9BURK|nr:hypothetical protein [Massilia aquatica]
MGDGAHLAIGRNLPDAREVDAAAAHLPPVGDVQAAIVAGAQPGRRQDARCAVRIRVPSHHSLAGELSTFSGAVDGMHAVFALIADEQPAAGIDRQAVDHGHAMLDHLQASGLRQRLAGSCGHAMTFSVCIY